MTRMKPIKDKFILLFSPHAEECGRRVIPLALLAISTYLEKDYDIRIFQSYDKEDYTEAIKYLDRAICVGITAMTGTQVKDGIKFAKLIREKNKNVPIVWGGVHATIKPEQTLASPYADIVVRGQGEETFAELVRALDLGRPLNNILGLGYKKDGRLLKNPERPYKSIKELPAVPYHIIDDTIERYIKKNAYADRNLIYLSSAGCPFRCRFCYLGNTAFERAYDPLPAERVVRELKYLADRYHITGVELRDSNFFIDKQRCHDIFSGLIKAGVKLRISLLNGRANQLASFSDSFWQLMEDAGATEVLIGAESGDQEMLDYIDKKIKVEDILECERKARKFKVNVFNSFITGFPIKEENLDKPKRQLKKELNRTVDLVSRLFKINPAANVVLFYYTPYPGTYFYENSVKLGFREPSTLEEWGKIHLTSLVTPWVTKSHKKKAIFLNKLFVLRKISSDEHFTSKINEGSKFYNKFRWLQKMRINKALSYWIDFRFRTKFFLFPFESWLIALAKKLK